MILTILYLQSLLIIQKHTRGFLIRNNKINKKIIISSYFQTKTWRKKQDWYKNGKSNECELYQRGVFEKITNIPCNKNTSRINLYSYEMRENPYPMRSLDGFEWTEDFDGFFLKNKRDIYVNFKFVCDKGGAQTRTLRELYHFISVQLNHLLLCYNEETHRETETKKKYFLNILDGDECFSNMNKFNYLLNKEIYRNVSQYIFVGDMHQFQKYWSKINSTI
jgi:hypothetical protein